MIARRQKDGAAFANSDDPETTVRYYDDIKNSCLAAYYFSRDTARFLLSHMTFSPYSATLRLEQPVLVVDTPELLVHDPVTQALGRTDWLVLNRMIEMAPGLQIPRAIDVVTPDGLQRMIGRIRETVPDALSGGFDGVHNIAAEQHERWRRLSERKRAQIAER